MKYLFTTILLFISFAVLAQESNDTTVTDGAKLFMPLAYDAGITSNAMSLDGDTTSLADRALMNVMLKHPDLVRSTYKQLMKHENNVEAVEAPVKMVEMVKNTSNTTIPDALPEDEDGLVDMIVTKPNFWTFCGDYNLQFLQNYISPNWYTSGNSTYSMLGAVTLQYNYNNKQRVKWDNKLELKLGFQTTDADTINNFKTTDDLVRYTSQLSLQAHKHWYYATQLIASTQFTRGLKNNDKTIYSDFMSPLNLNMSLGMNYEVMTCHKKLVGNILLAPFSYKLTYVDRADLATRFGIREGRRAQNDIGSLINAELTWKPLENFKWETRLYTYTTYQKFQFEWENTLTFQFNRYIATKLFIYPRFDDAADKITSTYWQLKEHLSIGFSYSM